MVGNLSKSHIVQIVLTPFIYMKTATICHSRCRKKMYLGKSLAEIADMQQSEKSESANWKRQELQAQIDLMNDIMQIADSAERGISDKGKISPQIQRGRTIARTQEHMSMIDLLTAEQEEHFNDC